MGGLMSFSFDPGDAFERGLRARARQLRVLAATTRSAVARGTVAIGQAAARRLGELTPRSDGPGPHLADAWATEVEADRNELTVRVTNKDPRANEPIQLASGREAPYSLLQILEYGSRPHEIEPVNGEYLAFFSHLLGRVVFSKKVHHPGTRPYSMVAITRAQAQADLVRLLNAVRTVVRRGGA